MIIVENTDPPAAIVSRPQVTMFSKNPQSVRYGFFPVDSEPPNGAPESPTESASEG